MATQKLRPGVPALVRCPPTKVLALDGVGAPESPAFQAAIGALYGVAYTLKFARKKAGGAEIKIGALEGLWSVAGEGGDAWNAARDQWQWKLCIAVPADVTAAEVRTAARALIARRGDEAAVATAVRLETLREGAAVEALHVGPYASEPLTIQAMRAFMAEHHLRARGRHHEIYLGDPRRAAPSKLRTILRQPVARTAS